MAWDDTVSAGDVITSASWNTRTDILKDVSGNTYGHSSNKDLHFPSSQLLTWLNALYQESGTAGTDVAWSGASEFYGLSSNIYTQTWIDNLSGSIDSRLDTLEGYDVFDSTLYILSTSAISRFSDSSNYSTHKVDGDIHFPSSSITPWLDSVYAPTGVTGVGWSGASEFYGFSSNSKSLYSPSSSINLNYLDSISGNAKQGYDFSSNSALVKNGYVTVSHGDTIAHGLNAIPVYANVTPSGTSVNFGVSCKFDSTNITVALTAAGNRDIYWLVSM